MQKLNLSEIAELNSLQYIETTSGSNGYPQAIKSAIIGFDTFEEAQKLADEHNLNIEFFTKKDGWQLWCRTGNNAHEEMKNSSDDYGDNYSQFDKMTEEEFLINEVLPVIKDIEMTDNNNFDFLETFIKQQKELFNKIDELEENEIVITCQCDYYDTIKENSMYFYHDTKHTTIGLIDRN